MTGSILHLASLSARVAGLFSGSWAMLILLRREWKNIPEKSVIPDLLFPALKDISKFRPSPIRAAEIKHH